MRVRPLAVVVAITAVMFVSATGLSACSSSGSTGLPGQTSASPSPGSASSFALYKDARYGFSVLCPKGWAGGVSKGGSALACVSWANPHGKQVDGQYVDALQVSVYKMSKAAKPKDLVKDPGDFKAMVDSLIKGLPKLAVTDPFKPVAVNGTKGFQVTYAYDLHNTPTGAMSYLLVKGRYVYWITGQASSATWSQAWKTLAPAMASLTIKAVTTK